MRFSFKCLAIRHASGRVTVAPLDFPELAVHALDVARAALELTLALDDRISRAHPRRLPELSRPAVGELGKSSPQAIKVRGAESDELRPLVVTTVTAPAHKPYTEVRAPRLAARFWVTGKHPDVEGLLTETLADTAEHDLLDLRSEGGETLLDLELDVTPLRLSDLKRKELVLLERAPPAPPDEKDDKEKDENDDEDDEPRVDDGWDDKRKKSRKPRTPRRPAIPTLKQLGVPWHELAAEDALDHAWERDDLVEELRRRVSSETPDPIVLVGPAGAGKTAILHELTRRLKDRLVFFLDGSRLIAGQGFFGDWQRQTLDAWKEAQAAKVILHLGRVRDLLDAGKSAHSDQNVAQLLTPMLAAREVAVVAEATPEEWPEVERRNAGFARTFAVLRVDDPSPAAAERILARLATSLAPPVEAGAVATTLSLCARFLPYGALVGNAVAFLRRLVDTRAQAMARRVTGDDALALFSAESGVPPALLRDDLPLDEDETRAYLAERVHGQTAAVARVARAVSVIKANLADRGRPSAVLIFAGPTGVGKTELSKALAELVFGSRERLVRLDMGEYAGGDCLARLLGERGAPGHLTAAVRRQPFSLVLLDEIEKAHPVVFDALLGVLGEGRLTGGDGRLVDFRASIIVMTSNLGAETFRARPGFGGAAMPAAQAHYRAAAAGFFRPELWNRIDDLVVFEPLGAPEIRTIVDRELTQVVAREGLRRRDVSLVVDDGARARLCEIGLDPRYGARPLKRAIERHLVAPVAAWLAEHPPTGALRLTATAAGLEAESLGGAAEGVSRAAIAKLLERAARVRGEVRRYSRSPAMTRLRHELAFFDRLSRQVSFWHDRAIADETARAAAEGRELDRELEGAERQAEAAEDLAYEAWYARQVAAASSLEGELASVERGLHGLKVRLHATLFPPRNTVAVELVPGKGAWEQLTWLTRGWSRRLTGANIETWILEEREVKDKDAKDKAAKKTKTEERWRKTWLSDETPGLAAVFIASTTRDIMLLSAEHGAHRFVAGAQTAIVRCRFEPRPSATLPVLAELERRAPGEEIRRVWRSKREVRDLRLEQAFKYDDDELDLAALWDAWLDRRVLGGGET